MKTKPNKLTNNGNLNFIINSLNKNWYNNFNVNYKKKEILF